MDIETKVKTALLIRGFDNEKMLNNRGLIGATIDETVLAVVKNLGIANVSQQRELLIDFMKSLNGMEKHLINKGEFESVANRFLSINCA